MNIHLFPYFFHFLVFNAASALYKLYSDGCYPKLHFPQVSVNPYFALCSSITNAYFSRSFKYRGIQIGFFFVVVCGLLLFTMTERQRYGMRETKRPRDTYIHTYIHTYRDRKKKTETTGERVTV